MTLAWDLSDRPVRVTGPASLLLRGLTMFMLRKEFKALGVGLPEASPQGLQLVQA